jgi:acyl carrier protein
MQSVVECVANAMGRPTTDIAELDEETLLTEQGMDSIRFIQMIVLLEDALEIEILDSDLLLENFKSKKAIFETLEKYLES